MAEATTPQTNSPAPQKLEQRGVVGPVEKPIEVVTTDTPEVQGYQTAYSDVTDPASIGSIVMQKERELQEPLRQPTVLTSTEGKKQIKKDQQDLATVQQEAPISPPPTPSALPDESLPEIKAIDAELSKYQSEYDNYTKGLESDQLAQINAIKGEYDALRGEMEITNKAIMGTLETIGLKSGRSRYAPDLQLGRVSAEAKAGQSRISQLVREETALIASAEAAARDQKWGAFNQSMNMVRSSRKDKAQAIEAHKNALFKAAEQERENLKFVADMAFRQQEFEMKAQEMGFQQALRVSQQNDTELSIDGDGNVYVSNTPTADRMREDGRFMLSQAEFGFSQDKFEQNILLDKERIKLQQAGFNLNVDKFNLDVDKFGYAQAVQNAELSMQYQKMALDRYKDGIPTTYDDLGIAAPGTEVAQMIGDSIVQTIGDSVNPQNGFYKGKAWQCGYFSHEIVDYPPIGDSVNEKKASVDRASAEGWGVKAEQWRGSPAVGDVIITDGSDSSKDGRETTYGHVAVVTAVNADGTVSLIEANQRGQGRIRDDRRLSINSPSIYGAIRGDLKDGFQTEAEAMAQQSLINDASTSVVNATMSSDHARVMQEYNSVVIGLNKSDQEIALNQTQAFIQDGDIDGLNNYYDGLAYQKLSATEKTSFNQYTTASENSGFVIDNLLTQANLTTGVYKSAWESTKPFIEMEKDQSNVELVQAISRSDAEIRNAMFGASLTDSEKESAYEFLIDTSKDSLQTIGTKLRGARNFYDQVSKKQLEYAKGNLDYKMDLRTVNDGNLETLSQFNPLSSQSNSNLYSN